MKNKSGFELRKDFIKLFIRDIQVFCLLCARTEGLKLPLINFKLFSQEEKKHLGRKICGNERKNILHKNNLYIQTAFQHRFYIHSDAWLPAPSNLSSAGRLLFSLISGQGVYEFLQTTTYTNTLKVIIHLCLFEFLFNKIIMIYTVLCISSNRDCATISSPRFPNHCISNAHLKCDSAHFYVLYKDQK